VVVVAVVVVVEGGMEEMVGWIDRIEYYICLFFYLVHEETQYFF
jgi:hypothetical protein